MRALLFFAASALLTTSCSQDPAGQPAAGDATSGNQAGSAGSLNDGTSTSSSGGADSTTQGTDAAGASTGTSSTSAGNAAASTGTGQGGNPSGQGGANSVGGSGTINGGATSAGGAGTAQGDMDSGSQNTGGTSTAVGGMGGLAASMAGASAAAGSGGATGGQDGAGNAGGCDNPAFILCEDFESTGDGNVPGGWDQSGEAAVASDDAYNSTRSLKIAAAENGARRITHGATDFGSVHWGRVRYKVQLPVPTVFVHSTIVALFGDGPTVGSAEYRVVDTVKDANGTHQFLYNVQPDGAEFGKGSSYDWMFDGEWHCAEWFIDGDNQAYRFFFDGEEVTQIAIENGPGNYGSGQDQTDIPTEFSSIRVGWNNYQSASPGFVAWLDDLAISATQIGCE